jgi:hypothetical protein
VSYAYYRTVTIDHTKVPNTDQTNYPVAVAGTLASLATIANGGRCTLIGGVYPDIAFFSDAALTTALKFERTLYTAATGAHTFYVKVPTLSHTVDTVIYVAYGDASLGADPADPTNVWDANFKAVYHFGDGSGVNLNDSTSNAKNLTNNGSTATTGLIDGAMAAGTNAAADTATLPLTAMPLTIEALFNPNDTTTTGTLAAFDMSTQASGVFELTKRPSGVMRIVAGTGATAINLDTGASVYTASAWNYCAGVWTSTTSRAVHPNGQAPTTSATSQSSATPDQLGVGETWRQATKSNYLAGKIGEVRISNIARSADWIVTTYNNLVGIATFYSVGSETAVGGGGGGGVRATRIKLLKAA